MTMQDGGQDQAQRVFEPEVPTAFRLPPPGREADLEAFPVLAPLPDWPDPIRPHPRLVLTPDRLEALRRDVEHGFLKDLWPRLWNLHLKRCDLPPEPEQPADRAQAYTLAWRALRWAVTREPAALQEAIRWMEATTSGPICDHHASLAPGELLVAVALTLDWAHADLPAATTARARQWLALTAAQIARGAEAGAVWWATCWLQNHFVVNESGIGLAAMALADAPEEPVRRVALDLYRHAVTRMRKSVFFQPPDGSSPELCRYAYFMTEAQLLLFEALRTFSGEDLYGPFARRRIDHIIHQMIPAPSAEADILNWGDNDRSCWPHPPVSLLYALARRFGDPLAQAAGDWLVARGVGIDRNKTWLIPLHRDPALQPADFPPGADRLPRSYHAEDQGLVTMRSSWAEDATMVGLLCGPFQGHRLRDLVSTDVGAAHRHPDNASFQICAGRTFLAIDPGYELLKSTANHNTILVDGHGQVGGGNTWFNVNNALNREGEALRIEAFEDTGNLCHAVAQAAGAYDPDLHLTDFTRRLIFIRSDLIIVHDRLASSVPHEYRWMMHSDPQHRFDQLGPGHWRLDASEAGLEVRALRPEGMMLAHEVRLHQITRSRFVRQTRRLDLYPVHQAKTAEFLIVMRVLRGRDVHDAPPLTLAVESDEQQVRLTADGIRVAWPVQTPGRPTLLQTGVK